MAVTPYLFFNGRCEEAIDFYKQALGAEVGMLMRFKDCPEPLPPDAIPSGSEDKIMHACMHIKGAPVMASDGCSAGEPANFAGISLSITTEDEAEGERMFDALADGGKIEMPMEKTFFAKRFGVVADRFGVSWMIVVEP